MTDRRDEAILARARVSLQANLERGRYSRELGATLAEPLDLHPDPAVVAGPSWAEALGTATVSVAAPQPSLRWGVGPLVTAAKRAVDRAMRWYLPPVAAQATRHNRAVLEVLAEHNRHILELREEVDRLRERVRALEDERRG